MSSKLKSKVTNYFSASRNKQSSKQKQGIKKEAKNVVLVEEKQEVIEIAIPDIVEIKSEESKSEESKENLQPLLSPKIKPVNLEKVAKVSPVKAEPPSPKSAESQKTENASTLVDSSDVVIKDLETTQKTSKKTTKKTKRADSPKLVEIDLFQSEPSPEKPKPSTKSKKDKTQKIKDKKSETEPKDPVKPTSKTKKSTKSKKEIPLSPNQKKITDFNFIRRSRRVPTTEKRKIEEEQLKFYLASDKDEALEHIVMKMTEEKGRGIFANQDLRKGDFVVEYAGDLMSLEEGKEKEAEYSEDAEIGSYIYFFCFKGKRYCIDATGESGRYGRLLNHSKVRANCKTRLVEEPEGHPRLIIEAKCDVTKDTELLYDYGDRSQKALIAHPWLKE